MDKVRYAGDLSQDEAPGILQAYPEEEPQVLDDSLETEQPLSADQNGIPCKQSVFPKRKK